MRDLRKYANQTQTRLLIGLCILTSTLGLGLVWFFYGWNAAIIGSICLTGVLATIFLIVLVLNSIERILKK